MKKIITFLLVLVLSMSVCFSLGCSNNDNTEEWDPNNSGSGNINIIDNESDKGYVGSYANTLKQSTGEYIISSKTTDYKIVYPKNAGNAIYTAIDEFNTFVSESTGVVFDAIDDENVVYSDNSKYISFGQTSLLHQAGITVRNDLGACGTQIITKGKTIFVFGNNDRSSLYAVYDLLSFILDFDYIYKDCYNLDKNVKDIELKIYNEVNIPDIEQRSSGYGWTDTDMLMSYRMRLTHKEYDFMAINSKVGHNSFEYVKGKDTGHEGYWYSSDHNQLCYTAHGNEAEYEALQQTCFETLKENLMRDRSSHVVTFTQEDIGTWCYCDACQNIINQYGTESAILVLFMNDLRAKLDDWFSTPEGQEYYRDLELIFFAYHKTTPAPAHYDAASGKYVGNNGIHCVPGVSVWYAPIDADYTHSLYHKKNETYLENLYKWQAVSNKMFLWVYSTGFSNYFCPYNSFDGMQDTYKLAKEINAVYIMDQAQWTTSECYSWGCLKSYLNAKLGWNSDADVDFLTKRFFNNYFGPIANEMYRYYLNQRLYLSWLSDNTNYSCRKSCSNGNIGKEEYWKKPVLESWLAELNSAIGKLADLKRSNPDLYTVYYNRAALERLSVYYLLVDLYSYNTSAEKIMEYKLQFKKDAKAIGCEGTNEASKTVDQILEEWGV